MKAKKPASPKVQAAMDTAISPEARALLVQLLRAHSGEHHGLYRQMVYSAAGVIYDGTRKAADAGDTIPTFGAAHAIFEVFEEAAKGTPSELKRDAE